MESFKTLLLGTPPTRTYTASATGLLTSANNLSDVADAATARTNLGLGTGSSPQFSSVGVGGAAPGSNGLKVFGTTASTSTTTGALQVAGGAGIAGAAFVGGNLTVSGTGGHNFAAPASGPALIIRHTGATKNPGLYFSNNESTGASRIAASGSSGPFSLELAIANDVEVTITETATTLAGNLTVAGGTLNIGASGAGGYYSAGTFYGPASTDLTLAAGNANGNVKLTPAGSGVVQVNGNLTTGGTITTSAPTGGAGAWELGVANVVSPTSPNRTITIEIGGTVYYLHAKTTND